MPEVDLLETSVSDTPSDMSRAGSGGGAVKARSPERSRGGDALAAARVRGAEFAGQMLDGPDMLDSSAFCARLGISEKKLQQLRSKHRVVELTGGGRRRYPEWQIGPDGAPLAVLPQLFASLHAPWAVHDFVRRPQSALSGQTPLQALKNGKQKVVVAIAEGFTENPD